MAHNTNFRPFHTYKSYYPYYLPSYYSRFYPNHYDRYFEPTTYELEKHQPVIVEQQQNYIDIDSVTPSESQSNEKLVKWFIVLFILFFGLLSLKSF